MSDPIKQALEALKLIEQWDANGLSLTEFHAEKARAAIAALEGLEKAEPVRLASKRCSNALRINGEAYPRTCQVCGLGPCGLGSHPAPVQAEPGWRMVPVEFLRGFSTLAHNYSLPAEPPFFYDGMAGDAFRNAYRRCGEDLAALRAMLNAAPQPAAQVVGLTDQQIIAITDEIPIRDGFFIKIARAVEAAHGIKAP